METNSGATTGKRDYLESRLAFLGITEDENKIRLHGCHQVAFDTEKTTVIQSVKISKGLI